MTVILSTCFDRVPDTGHDIVRGAATGGDGMMQQLAMVEALHDWKLEGRRTPPNWAIPRVCSFRSAIVPYSYDPSPRGLSLRSVRAPPSLSGERAAGDREGLVDPPVARVICLEAHDTSNLPFLATVGDRHGELARLEADLGAVMRLDDAGNL